MALIHLVRFKILKFHCSDVQESTPPLLGQSCQSGAREGSQTGVVSFALLEYDVSPYLFILIHRGFAVLVLVLDRS